MVVVEEVTKLSERRTETSSEVFPDDALASVRAAIETTGQRLRQLDQNTRVGEDVPVTELRSTV